MNRVFEILKKYMIFIAILTGISIVLGMSYSNFIVASENHKVAEMYIGTLKYSMTIDGSTTNTLSVPSGETIIDVTITNENPIDTYYKLIYQNNSNVSIKYYESTKDTNDNVTNYSSPNSKITSNNKNTIKLKITNSSTSSQKVTFKIVGGFATNTLNDVTVPSGYTIIGKDTSTNTYFCTTTDTLTQGLKYVNGQYTYAYKQEYYSSSLVWKNINSNGWGVQLTDKASTDSVTSKVCTYINNKPITSMSGMFASSQAASINVSDLNTFGVTNMWFMFSDTQVTTLDLSSFDTSNVTDMAGMFAGSQATTLDVSSFNTSKVTNMFAMFNFSEFTTLDLSSFNTSNVTGMNSMFNGSQAKEIKGLSNFDTSKVTGMNGMFYYSQAITLDLSSFDTSNVTDMGSMFSSSQATTLDVSNFDTSKVTSMNGMFNNSQAATLDVSNFDTSNVTDMSWMFSSSKATTLDLSSFNTSNVTNMGGMFGNVSNLKTIYVSSKFVTTAVTDSTDMFTDSTKIVGGSGTKYNNSYVDKTYAHIDGGTSNPGYFTDVADKDIPEPNSFATDSWKTIAKAARINNTDKYNVGDTRTIDMGTYGTHTLRLANKSTPSECSTTGFSQSACGFVVEFTDIITTHNMNPAGEYNGTQYNFGHNIGGWPVTSMRTFVNNDIYNALPSDLRNVIIDTLIVSSHGNGDTENFTSTDKLYLLAPKEVYIDFSQVNDTSKDLTRTLDYYTTKGVTINKYNGAIKKNGTNIDGWWLRSAFSIGNTYYYTIGMYTAYETKFASTEVGVSPAFRIG